MQTMLEKRSAFLIAFFIFWSSLAVAAPKPKLVVLVVVDQFRYDYLTRYRSEYKGGFDRMLSGGAVFTNANYLQYPTVTAVGHSTVLSGAFPAISGIVGNTWYDRATGVQVTSVCDSRYKLVGATREEHDAKRCEDSDPASPSRMLVSTVGDELRYKHNDSVVIGISFKARSAILPAGHQAKGAFWFDDTAGAFVSSTYYSEALPEWVAAFNARKLSDKYLDAKWPGFDKWDFHSKNAKRAYEKLAASPWGNELIEALAESALSGEKLGTRGATDILTVSFSSNDYVGHQVGPDAAEVHDMCLRTDKLVGKLMAAVEAKVGVGNALFVLTADHGVAPLPAEQEKRKMPGGYLTARANTIINKALTQKFGAGDWVLAGGDSGIYIDWKVADRNKAGRAEVMRAAAEAILEAPEMHAARVYTRDELTLGIQVDPLGRAATYGFNQARGGDVVIIHDPYWLSGTTGTTHSTPYHYDSHVPVIFYGAGVRAAQYPEEIAVNDIAPTLSAILGIEAPSGSSGRVLEKVVNVAQNGPQR